MISFNVLNSTNEQTELHQCYSLHQLSQPNPWSFSTFSDMAITPYTIFYGQDEHAGIVSYSVGLNVVGEVTLMDIAVAKVFKHKGIASQLLDFFINFYQSQNASSILLEVRESNHVALRLYRKFNFAEIALRENYYPGIQVFEQRENAIIMNLKI